MNKQQILNRLGALAPEYRALVDKSTAGTFGDEDQARYDALVVEINELRVKLGALETRERESGELLGALDALVTPAGTRAAGSVARGQENAAAGQGGTDSRGRAAGAQMDMRSIARRVIESEALTEWRARGGSGVATVNMDGGFYHAGAGDLSSVLIRSGSRQMAHEQRGLVYTGSFPAGAVEADRVPGILQQQFVRPSVRDAFGSTPTTSNLITFIRELLLSHTNGAAFVAEPSVHDGATGLKPQSTLVFDGDEAAVREIATWVPISENIKDDLPGLESLINNRLLDFLAQEEDNSLVNGSGVTPELEGLLTVSGIQVADATYFSTNPVNDVGMSNEDFNRILAAVSLVQTVGLASASFILMHPTAYNYMLTVTDANRNYLGGGPFVTGALPRIWGIPVIQTDKLPDEATAIVGDGRMAEVRDRLEGQIDVGWINDQFVRDMQTIRAKERLAFPIYRPAAFVELELALN